MFAFEVTKLFTLEGYVTWDREWRMPSNEDRIGGDCASAMMEENIAVECEQFLGGLLNSYYRKAA